MAGNNQAWIDISMNTPEDEINVKEKIGGDENGQQKEDTGKKGKLGCFSKMFRPCSTKANEEPKTKVKNYEEELRKINEINALFKQGDQDSCSVDIADDNDKSTCTCCFGFLVSWFLKKLEERRERRRRKMYEVEELKKKVRFSEFVMVIPPPVYIADDTECDAEELDGVEVLTL